MYVLEGTSAAGIIAQEAEQHGIPFDQDEWTSVHATRYPSQMAVIVDSSSCGSRTVDLRAHQVGCDMVS
jgi:hypothetical protein